MTDTPRPAGAPAMKLRHLRWIAPRLIIVYTLVVITGAAFFGWPFQAAGAIAVVLLVVMIDGFARPSSSLFYPTLTHGPRGSRRVALTFDDGPDPVVTPAVLDVLTRYRARATFFVIGKSLAAQPELARRIIASGHVLANHSWQHSHWQNFHLTRWHKEELARCEQAIAEATGSSARALYRPPVGLKSPELAHAVWDRGLIVVAWSVHSRDTLDSDPARIARRVLSRVQGGDIVLLHDGHHLGGQRPHCAEAARLILEGFKEKGLECVTLPELLELPASNSI